MGITAASGDVWGGSPGPSVPWNQEAVAKRREGIAAYRRIGIHQNKLTWFNGLTTRKGVVIGHIRRPIWDMIYKWDALQPLHAEPRFLLGTSVVGLLKKQQLSVPVMVLTGDVDAGKKNKLLELVPSAKQVIIKNAGHVSNLEKPAEFTEAVTNFISIVNSRPKSN